MFYSYSRSLSVLLRKCSAFAGIYAAQSTSHQWTHTALPSINLQTVPGGHSLLHSGVGDTGTQTAWPLITLQVVPFLHSTAAHESGWSIGTHAWASPPMTRHSVPGSHCIGKVHSWVGNCGIQTAYPPMTSQTVPASQRVTAHGLVIWALAEETHWACSRKASHTFPSRSHASKEQASLRGTQISQHCPFGVNRTSPGEQNVGKQWTPIHGSVEGVSIWLVLSYELDQSLSRAPSLTDARNRGSTDRLE